MDRRHLNSFINGALLWSERFPLHVLKSHVAAARAFQTLFESMLKHQRGTLLDVQRRRPVLHGCAACVH